MRKKFKHETCSESLILFDYLNQLSRVIVKCQRFVNERFFFKRVFATIKNIIM